jgi:hypothetical protein
MFRALLIASLLATPAHAFKLPPDQYKACKQKEAALGDDAPPGFCGEPQGKPAIKRSTPGYSLVDRTLNACMTQFIDERRPGGPAGDDWISYCMQRHRFEFCDRCKIFDDTSEACEEDKDNALYRPRCWAMRQ